MNHTSAWILFYACAKVYLLNTQKGKKTPPKKHSFPILLLLHVFNHIHINRILTTSCLRPKIYQGRHTNMLAWHPYTFIRQKINISLVTKHLWGHFSIKELWKAFLTGIWWKWSPAHHPSILYHMFSTAARVRQLTCHLSAWQILPCRL